MKIKEYSALLKFRAAVKKIIGQYGQRKVTVSSSRFPLNEQENSLSHRMRLGKKRRAVRKELETWMGRIIPDSAKVGETVIPGSHDSASSDLEYFRIPFLPSIKLVRPLSLVRKLIQRFATTQGGSIRDQLDRGIRFLDLRMTYEEGRGFVLHHGAAMGDNIDTAMEDISDFLTMHPNEAVFIKIELDRWINKERKDELCTTLSNNYSHLFHPCEGEGQSLGDLSFGALRKSQKNLVVILEDKGSKRNYQPPSGIKHHFWNWHHHVHSRWANTAKRSTLWKRNNQFLDTENKQNRMVVSQLQMTALVNPVLKPLEAILGVFYGVKGLARRSNTQAAQWLMHCRRKNKPVNVVIIDYVDDRSAKDMVKAAIAMNTRGKVQPQDINDRGVTAAFPNMGASLNRVRRQMVQ